MSSVVEKKYKKAFNIVHAIFRLMNSSQKFNDLLKKLAKIILQATDSQYCSITLFNINAIPIVRASCKKKQPQAIFQKLPKRNLSRVNKLVYETAKIIKKKNEIYLPLVTDRVLGTMRIKRKKGAPFDETDEVILIFLAEQIASGIKTAILAQEQERILLGTVRLISMFLEEKVPPMHAHKKLFLMLIKEISKELQLSPGKAKTLEVASIIHDAGKMKLPLYLLTKTTPLSEKEMEIIKRHPLFSAQILGHIQLLKPVIPIILHHHERYDGKGYPSGLKKQHIPIESRIMSIIDAFDAMISDRPYKKKITPQEAVEEINKHSGTQFDPKIVGAFLKVVNRKKIKKILNSL